MGFTLHILGWGSAMPRFGVNPTAQALEVGGQVFLIDCGEGVQGALRKSRIKFTSVRHIFISHLHGDHYFGLIGLISTFHLLGRTEPLTVYSPRGLSPICRLQLQAASTNLKFDLNFVEINTDEPLVVFQDKKVSVTAFPLKHRVETYGYLFREAERERRLNPRAANAYQIPICDYHNLKKGKDYLLPDGTLIPNEKLTFDPPPARSYAFCSDTVYSPALAKWVAGVDLLYHESTFLETEREVAEKTLHSTARQAALVARDSGAKKLLLGHFSARYEENEAFGREAREVFEPVFVAGEVTRMDIE